MTLNRRVNSFTEMIMGRNFKLYVLEGLERNRKGCHDRVMVAPGTLWPFRATVDYNIVFDDYKNRAKAENLLGDHLSLETTTMKR